MMVTLVAALLAAVEMPPLVMMRFASVQTASLAEWRETAKAFAANPRCCDEVWFSTGESFPGMEWHRRHMEVVRVAAADMRRQGIGVSLQFEATIGHGDTFPTAEEKRVFEKPWTGWTGANGAECQYCNCPRQPAFLRRLAEVSELYAEIQPAVVWIDDDLRLTMHNPVLDKNCPGCWCATCVAGFAREEGREWTRQSLYAAWQKDAALQARWHDYSARSLAEVACVIARAFRKVSPSTRIGLQTAGDRMRMIEIVVRAIKAATGEKASVRLGGGAYYDLAPYGQIAKSRRMAADRRKLNLEDIVGNWCTEVESYPRAYGSRSVRSIALESFSSLAWGFDTTSLFVLDRRSETDEFYSRYLLKPLATVTKFLNQYRADSADTIPAGLECEIPADDERILMGLPVLPGVGKSWGTISGEREKFPSIGAVWGEFRDDLMTDYRKTPSAKVQAIRDRLSGAASLKVASPFIGLVMPRVDEAGRLRTIGLIGASLDAQYNVTIEVKGAAEYVRWCELGEAPKELRVKNEGTRRTVTIPSIGSWGLGYLKF